MESKQTVVRGGSSLFSIAFVLTLVFFILKVTNVLAWSWVWILSPLWIYLALVAVGLTLAFLILIIMIVAREVGQSKRRQRNRSYHNVSGTPVPNSWWRS